MSSLKVIKHTLSVQYFVSFLIAGSHITLVIYELALVTNLRLVQNRNKNLQVSFLKKILFLWVGPNCHSSLLLQALFVANSAPLGLLSLKGSISGKLVG